MKTWLLGKAAVDQYGDISYCMPCGEDNYNYRFSEYMAEQIIPTDGTILRLRVYQRAAAGAQGYTYTLRKNNADTAISFTINNPNLSGTDAGSVSVSAGDRVCISAVRSGSAPTADVQYCSIIEFDSTADHESIVMMTTCDDARTTNTYWWSPFGRAIMRDDTMDARMAIPWPGTISKFYVNLTSAPGAGTSRTFGLSVKDDTSPDISVQIADAATSGSDTSNSTSVKMGDWVSIYQQVSGAAANGVMRAGWVYTATGADLFLTGFTSPGGNVDDGTYYGGISSSSAMPTTTETDRQDAGHSDFYLVGAYGLIETAPPAGKGYTIKLREGGADASEPMTFVIGEGSDHGGSLAAFRPADGGWLNWKSVSYGTPDFARLWITYIGNVDGTLPRRGDFWPVILRMLDQQRRTA